MEWSLGMQRRQTQVSAIIRDQELYKNRDFYQVRSFLSFYALLKPEVDLPRKLSLLKGNLTLGRMGQLSAKDLCV